MLLGLTLLLLAAAAACLLLGGGQSPAPLGVPRPVCWALALAGALAAAGALARHPRGGLDRARFAEFLLAGLALSPGERRRYEAMAAAPGHPLARHREAAFRRLAGEGGEAGGGDVGGDAQINGAALVERRAHERLWERHRLDP